MAVDKLAAAINRIGRQEVGARPTVPEYDDGEAGIRLRQHYIGQALAGAGGTVNNASREATPAQVAARVVAVADAVIELLAREEVARLEQFSDAD